MKLDHHLEARNKSRLAALWFLDSVVEKPESIWTAICSPAFSPLEKPYYAGQRCHLLLCHGCQAGLSAVPITQCYRIVKLSFCEQLILLVILFTTQQLFMCIPLSHPPAVLPSKWLCKTSCSCANKPVVFLHLFCW